ncbi:hypothetical protein FI667_g10835, partial [Globisporangium splendens]
MLTFEFRPSPLMHPEESLDSRDSAWSLRSMWSKMLVKEEVVCGVDSILCSKGTTKCTRVMAVAFTVRTHAVVRKSQPPNLRLLLRGVARDQRDDNDVQHRRHHTERERDAFPDIVFLGQRARLADPQHERQRRRHEARDREKSANLNDPRLGLAARNPKHERDEREHTCSDTQTRESECRFAKRAARAVQEAIELRVFEPSELREPLAVQVPCQVALLLGAVIPVADTELGELARDLGIVQLGSLIVVGRVVKVAMVELYRRVGACGVQLDIRAEPPDAGCEVSFAPRIRLAIVGAPRWQDHGYGIEHHGDKEHDDREETWSRAPHCDC